MKKRYFVTAHPIASCLCWPWEKKLLEGKSVTVELECSSMGKINRNRIMRLAMDACYKVGEQTGVKVGGMGCSHPKEVV